MKCITFYACTHPKPKINGYGRYVHLRHFPWPKRPWSKCPGQNVIGRNVLGRNVRGRNGRAPVSDIYPGSQLYYIDNNTGDRYQIPIFFFNLRYSKLNVHYTCTKRFK